MSCHISDVIHLWIQLVASMVIFYKNGDLTIFLQDRHDAHLVWTISSNLFFAKTIINHPPTSHLTFFPPHNSNSTLQTCRGQWEVVRGWELGWISKTQRRWTLFGNWRNGWLRVWTLGFILVFFRWRSILKTWALNTGLKTNIFQHQQRITGLGAIMKKTQQPAISWETTGKESKRISSRYLHQDPQSFFIDNFLGLEDLHHKLRWI